MSSAISFLNRLTKKNSRSESQTEEDLEEKQRPPSTNDGGRLFEINKKVSALSVSAAKSVSFPIGRLDSMFGNPKSENAPKTLSLLMDNNRIWAKQKVSNDPQFFSRLGSSQSPTYMWIGCSDSRVPANQIVSMPPGEIFVHRNVANLVYATDINCMSVLQYAVETLKVKHVIVCGHQGCGGVRAAFGPKLEDPLEGWLTSIRELKELHKETLDAIETEEDRCRMLVKLNVMAQVDCLSKLPIVKRAWENQQPLSIHGLFYSMKDGRLQDMNVSHPRKVSQFFDKKEAMRKQSFRHMLKREDDEDEDEEEDEDKQDGGEDEDEEEEKEVTPEPEHF